MSQPLGTLVTHAQQKPGVWGGGTTRMIYTDGADPTPAAAHLWIGTATIERDADYSYLPNRTRIHMPIAGNGIRLRFQHPSELITLTSLDQHQFDGGRPLHAELIDGPITAFNTIAHPTVTAAVQAHSLAQGQMLLQDLGGLPGPALHLIYVISGTLEIAAYGSAPSILHAQDAFTVSINTLPNFRYPEIMIQLHTRSEIVHVTISDIRSQIS
jgi:environmental stress-induced protein Ves